MGGGGSVDGSGIPTALKGLPELRVESVRSFSDGAAIQLAHHLGAKDYRVYVLPQASDIKLDGAGKLAGIQGATYRCAGQNFLPKNGLNDTIIHPEIQVHTLGTWELQSHKRTPSDETLGYLALEPSDGLVPVYALSRPAQSLGCYSGTSDEARGKVYTTDLTRRLDLIQAHAYRDDGVLGYAPASAGPHPVFGSTREIYSTQSRHWSGTVAWLYWAQSSAEDTARAGDRDRALLIRAFSASAAGLLPVHRVAYEGCVDRSDTLVLGDGEYEYRKQRYDKPVNGLTISGLTEPTVVVVEALDRGCPYTGSIAMGAVPAGGSNNYYKKWLTLDESRSQNSFSEAYINGQFASDTRPHAIARTFLRITPSARLTGDFADDFHPSEAPDVFTDSPDASTNCKGWGRKCFENSKYLVQFHTVEQDRWSIGTLLSGQLFARLADVAADVNGKLRITARQQARVSDGDFLHVGMDVTGIHTGRSYEQILVSSGGHPVQDNLPQNKTVIFHAIGDYPSVVEIQVCNQRSWDVNNQCPRYNLTTKAVALPDGNGLRPFNLAADYRGRDRLIRYDAYLSSRRAYLYIDGKPYGCANLDPATVPSGSVSVSYGHVLYHSGVRAWYYNQKREDGLVNALADGQGSSEKIEEARFYDNLSFTSGVASLEWDEKRFPCETELVP